MLKSEFINEIIRPRKLTTTKKNCKNVRDKILLSKFKKFLKFLIEKKIINGKKIYKLLKSKLSGICYKIRSAGFCVVDEVPLLINNAE